MASAAPDYLMEPMIRRFAVRASQDIAALPEHRTDRRLTVVLAGHHWDFTPPRACLWRVSNFEGAIGDQPGPEASDDFTLAYMIAKHPPEECVCLLLPAGHTAAVLPTDLEALHDLLHAGRPAVALVGKAVEILQATAESPRARGLIGKRATSIVLPTDPTLAPSLEYHSPTVTHKIGGVTHIEARGGEWGVFAVEETSFETYEATGRPSVLSLPKVGRNRPCPCGSGQRFKHCHGRTT